MQDVTTYVAHLDTISRVLSEWHERGTRLAAEARQVAATDRSSLGMIAADRLLHRIDAAIWCDGKPYFVRFEDQRPQVIESVELVVECHHWHENCRECWLDEVTGQRLRMWVPDPDELEEFAWEAQQIAEAEAYRRNVLHQTTGAAA